MVDVAFEWTIWEDEPKVLAELVVDVRPRHAQAEEFAGDAPAIVSAIGKVLFLACVTLHELLSFVAMA